MTELAPSPLGSTLHLLPYPAPSDPVSQGAAAIQALAEKVDQLVLSGRLDWGPPAGGAADTNLYRSAANTLKTDGQLNAAGAIFARQAAAGQTTIGDDPNVARIRFGSANDANLYRSAAGWLKTDGILEAGGTILGRYGTSGQVVVADDGTLARIRFGSAQDTNLYRNAAAQLKTDGVFTAFNGVVTKYAGNPSAGDGVDGMLWVDSAVGRLWIKQGGAWHYINFTG